MSFRVINRNAILDDEHEQRLRRIKVIKRKKAEMAPIWAAKQASLYPTALPISDTPSLGQVITEEIQKTATNPDIIFQRAELKLKKIADAPSVEYILDRLDDEDLKYLVNSWLGILKELKEKFNSTGLDKDVFFL